MIVRLREPNVGETALLARIVLEANVYTGPSFATLLAEAQNVAPLHRAHTRVVLADGQVAGFYRLVSPGRASDGGVDLDYLFVHRMWRGAGLGRVLVADALHAAGTLVAGHIHIVAHPPSERFFTRLGAVRTGTYEPERHRPWYCPTLRLDCSSGVGAVRNGGVGSAL